MLFRSLERCALRLDLAVQVRVLRRGGGEVVGERVEALADAANLDLCGSVSDDFEPGGSQALTSFSATRRSVDSLYSSYVAVIWRRLSPSVWAIAWNCWTLALARSRAPLAARSSVLQIKCQTWSSYTE